jgi:Na+/proline symporter
MSYLIIASLIGYFIIIFLISFITGKRAGNFGFFLGNRKSPWYIVAIGMIGASISGVTFVSVPGWVITSQFSYLQMVFGYLIGYFVIANVLMPLYYRLNIISIYGYLEKRFGFYSYKTGASFFLISRLVGSAVRLYLASSVLHFTVFSNWHIPFFVTVVITLLLIWLYTYRGGVKTIVWTDSVQAIMFLTAVIITIFQIADALNLNFKTLVDTIYRNPLSKTFFFDNFLSDPNHFIKQFVSGIFIAIVMTGLDQDMMQKNLSCKNINDAKKNMYWYSFALLPVNIIFLSLGVLLVIFANSKGIPIPDKTDNLYPMIATSNLLSPIVTVLFIIGLMAAALSSADSALTALTTSFTVDILNIQNKFNEEKTKKIRTLVHFALSILLILIIIIFDIINDESVISATFRIAGYTYGPLLGLFAFGLTNKKSIKDKYVPFIAIVSPIVCYFINKFSAIIIPNYKFGFELLLINGLLTYFGLRFLIKK